MPEVLTRVSPARARLVTGDWCGPALVLVVGALYLGFPSQRYDLDTLMELLRVERGQLISGDPAHGLYVPFGWLVWQVAQLPAPFLSAHTALLIVNALLGAMSIGVYFGVLRRSGVRRFTAVAVALAAGTAYGFWSHVADAFFIVPAATTALCAWYAALRAADDRAGASPWRLVAGLAFGLSILFHQANLFLAPALVLAGDRSDARTSARRSLMDVLVIGCAAAAVAVPFWLMQSSSVGVPIAGLPSWLLGSHGGMEQGLWRRDGIAIVPTTIVAWFATILPVYEGIRLRQLLSGVISPLHLAAQAGLVVLCASVLAGLVGWIIALRNRDNWLDRWTAVAALWFVMPAGSVIWFDRAEVKLWIIPFFGAWWLFAKGWDSLSDEYVGGEHGLVRVMVVCLVALIMIGNFLVAILPAHAEPSALWLKAGEAQLRVTPSDIVVTAQFDWTGHLAYRCPECRLLSLLGVAQQGRSAGDALNSARFEAEENGGKVYLVGALGDAGSDEWVHGLPRYTGLHVADVAALVPEVAWRFSDGETVWRATAPVVKE